MESKMKTNISVVNQLLPTLKALQRSDKLRIIQFLIGQLEQEEGINKNNSPVWTPYNAFNAADTLLNMLAEDKQQETQQV